MGESAEESARAGRELEQLIADHARLMAAAIRRVCKRQDLFHDIEQEVHLALYKKLLTGKEIRFPASYVYKVALTTAGAVLRRVAAGEEPIDPSDLERTAPDTAEEGKTDRKILLEQVLNELPREERAALRGYLSGFNHVEIAKLLGWTESVARHRIYRAREKLRKRAEEAKA